MTKLGVNCLAAGDMYYKTVTEEIYFIVNIADEGLEKRVTWQRFSRHELSEGKFFSWKFSSSDAFQSGLVLIASLQQ